MMDALDRAMVRGIEALKDWKAGNVRLFHHNDADGLSAAAILTRALTRAGYRIQRCCLEKPYPPVLETIFQTRDDLIIFADFAGRIAPLLSKLNRGRNLVLILDHHPAGSVADSSIHHLNPELFGYRGDRDASASTTCYRFARHLDPANGDLAYLAVTGAVGDSFRSGDGLAGLNRLAAEDAVNRGQLEILPESKPEAYRFRGPLLRGAVAEFAGQLDILGGAGFFQGGPEAAIRVCLDGFDNPSRSLCENLARKKEIIYRNEVDRLQSGSLRTTGQIQWIEVGERFNGLGVKMIGDFCRYIREKTFIDPEKYIAGFQPIPDTIPGLGRIAFQNLKVSMRVPAALEKRIINGEMPGLDELLPEATRAVGGFSDACHSLAAATTIPPGREEELIRTIDGLIRVWVQQKANAGGII